MSPTRVVDLHFHLLLGVDDGAQTVSDSVALLLLAHRGGTRHVVATPYILLPPFNNSDANEMRVAFENLQKEHDEIAHRLPFRCEMKIYLGVENLVSTEFLEALEPVVS